MSFPVISGHFRSFLMLFPVVSGITRHPFASITYFTEEAYMSVGTETTEAVTGRRYRRSYTERRHTGLQHREKKRHLNHLDQCVGIWHSYQSIEHEILDTSHVPFLGIY